MTQPVQEPTQGRTDAALGYGVRQLARRPSPATSGSVTIPYARRRQWDTSNQSINSGLETNVLLNEFVTDDATVFEAYDDTAPTPDINGIKVLTAGLYEITFRLYWNDWPGDHQMNLNGVDPDAWAPYSFYASQYHNTYSLAGAMSARLAADQILYMRVYHQFGGARALYGPGGCYFEMRRMGDISDTLYTDGGP